MNYFHRKLTVLSCALTGLISMYAPQHGLAQTAYHRKPVPIESRWAKEVSPENALKEYPRPQLTRKTWTNLNGLWDYAIADKAAAEPAAYDGKILVPYPIESSLSGVKKALLPGQYLWYKRTFSLSPKSGEKTLLHFGAVDFQATIYVNGKEAGSHEGGYTVFTLDITDLVKSGRNELKVRVWDPSDQGYGPHGKQVLNPQGIYYTPSSGIWQTTWLEQVPQHYIDHLTITPDLDKSVVNITVHSKTNEPVSIVIDGVAHKGNANENIAISLKDAKLWSPASPYLYTLTATLGSDKVSSYFGMRKISIIKDDKGIDRIALNNKPYYNLGTLDQGFWPDGLYTAPTDEALSFDIKAIKAMGFNTIRKHIKVEPARWYYWADKLGMLVWQDMVNPNQGLPPGAKEAFEKQSKEIIEQLHNCTCITTWVLFNEKWGQYDQERLTKWLKDSDPSRIVNGHTGELLYVNNQLRSPSPNAYVGADMTDVHAYPDPMISIKQPGKAQVCGEFGGIGVFIPDHQWLTGSAWGYVQEKPASLEPKFAGMVRLLEQFQIEGQSGSIYTQPFDVEGEQNGLMTYDRAVVKIPFAELRKIHHQLNPDAEINVPQVSAQDADLTDPAVLFQRAAAAYQEGQTPPEQIKRIAMLASQAGDKEGAAKFSAAYLATFKQPYSEEQIADIASMTTDTKSPGFAIMLKDSAAFIKAMGADAYRNQIQQQIFTSEIQPMFAQHKSWDEIGSALTEKFGTVGEETYLRIKVIGSLNSKDWANFVPAAKSYISKYGAHLTQQEHDILEKTINEHQ